MQGPVKGLTLTARQADVQCKQVLGLRNGGGSTGGPIRDRKFGLTATPTATGRSRLAARPIFPALDCRKPAAANGPLFSTWLLQGPARDHVLYRIAPCHAVLWTHLALPSFHWGPMFSRTDTERCQRHC